MANPFVREVLSTRPGLAEALAEVGDPPTGDKQALWDLRAAIFDELELRETPVDDSPPTQRLRDILEVQTAIWDYMDGAG